MKTKGIFWDKINDKVYYINFVDDNNIADVSTVRSSPSGGMWKISDDHIKIPIDKLNEFYFAGDYTRQMINDY